MEQHGYEIVPFQEKADVYIISVPTPYDKFSKKVNPKYAVITVGKNNVQVSEEFSTPEKQTSDTKYPKSVKIFNTGGIDTYIRVYADFSDSFVRSNSKFSDDGGTTYHNADRTDNTENVAISNEEANFVTYLNRKNRTDGGKWVFVTRLHPNIAKLSSELHYTDSVDATDYNDIQELLVASDVLISDYSSVVFDFMLSKRPCFMYATDIEEYRNDRNFYIPLDEMPFPISVDNRSFCESIEKFNKDDYNDAVSKFMNNYGIKEDGQASKRCVDWIIKQMEAK